MKTVQELITAWDAGESIPSLSMGGMGEGYENAIQFSAVEFARAGKDMPRTDDEKADIASFTKICDQALNAFDDKIGGITGAMYGAARWLAWQWCFNGGPEGLIARAKKHGQPDRVITVANAIHA